MDSGEVGLKTRLHMMLLVPGDRTMVLDRFSFIEKEKLDRQQSLEGV